jgi:hypothetical protein
MNRLRMNAETIVNENENLQQELEDTATKGPVDIHEWLVLYFVCNMYASYEMTISDEHKKTTTYGVGNQDTGLGQAQKCFWLSTLIPTLPHDNWISNENTGRYKQTIKKKTAQIGFHSKRPHTIIKINENINTDSTTAGSVESHS